MDAAGEGGPAASSSIALCGTLTLPLVVGGWRGCASSKSVRHRADGWHGLGHQPHFTTVAQLLRGFGYSLQANVKTTTITGASRSTLDSTTARTPTRIKPKRLITRQSLDPLRDLPRGCLPVYL